MIPIIDRYILKEVTKSFLAILAILFVIFLGQAFMKILQQAASGAISNDALFSLVALESLWILCTVLPPAFFLSILYAIGRMYRDSEMTAMEASGVGLLRIYRSIFYAALPVAIVVALLSVMVLPWMNQAKAAILKAEKQSAEFTTAIAGRFNEFRKGGLVFYVEDMSEDKSRLRRVFVQNRQHGKLGIVTAQEGYQYVDPESGDRFVVLKQGRRYEGEPGSSNYSIGELEKYGMRIASTPVGDEKVSRRALPTGVLLASDDLSDRAEGQARLLLPIAVLVFAVLSVPLCRSIPREGSAWQMALAILLYFVYMNLQAVSGSWMKDGVTAAWLGRWWVPIFMLGFGGALLFLRSRRFDRLQRSVWARVSR